jgi:hypothetical protein
MTGAENARQTLGEILDRLRSGHGWKLHIDDTDLSRLFGFVVGVLDPSYLRKENADAIERAKEFAKQHKCRFKFLEHMVPPAGVFFNTAM